METRLERFGPLGSLFQRWLDVFDQIRHDIEKESDETIRLAIESMEAGLKMNQDVPQSALLIVVSMISVMDDELDRREHVKTCKSCKDSSTLAS